MTSSQPTSDRIMGLITGYWATGIVGAAATHAVFTHLEDGAATADDVAARAAISPRGAQALLDGLVSVGLVEVHDGRYRNTAEASAFLVEGRPTCLSGFAKLKAGHMASLAGLPDVVRAGGPLTDAVVEVADNPHWEELVQALAAQSVPVAHTAADALRIADAGEIAILDIGGGSGVYSAAWLERNPAARSTQLDWAPINAIARRLLAERGLADRVTYVDGDFHTTDLGAAGAYDIVVYSNIAHQEGPEDNMALFARVREVLKPGGTLVISDYVVDDDRSGPKYPLTFASEMLLKSRHGSSWRRADYQAWLGKTGYDDVTFQTTLSPTTLIFAR
ncbi:class I SAM-dependent methyltransferase [Actinacidiphila paucisporea]|uniref:Dimerisation domain-containing protein n=1 Tax=Actinacidiphila paucisporea TaxID=310782 RepID=A0A1M7PLV5_9ACTN|nr:class I SAM-dependent methyltransferase [Actinacidiphila paucisporea]SHN18229.1 Dimerisation domain-containing protein [Actinacidiphila paucisporea]